MGELLDAFIVLLLLFGSAWVGMFVKGRLAERHRSKETSELVGLVILMLVTFAALVMSLLIFSVKGSFDQDDTDMAAIAGNIVRLDQCLRNYGPETRSMQAGLRSYTAAVIASTWPGEPKPSGSYYPQRAPPLSVGGMENRGLGRTVNRIRIGLHRLDPHSAFHSRVAQSCLDDFQSLEV
ncbi:MAG: hypothetical protein ACREFZ_08655, partial [Acetobacteraceae bacterium]